MYDHIGLKVKDLATATRFYRAALEPLGHGVTYEDKTSVGIGSKGEAGLWLYGAKNASGGSHVAFRATDRASVDRFHAAGVKAGGRDNGAPGLRKDYSPTYYAAFLIDPEGNNVEAVCLKAE